MCALVEGTVGKKPLYIFGDFRLRDLNLLIPDFKSRGLHSALQGADYVAAGRVKKLRNSLRSQNFPSCHRVTGVRSMPRHR